MFYIYIENIKVKSKFKNQVYLKNNNLAILTIIRIKNKYISVYIHQAYKVMFSNSNFIYKNIIMFIKIII